MTHDSVFELRPLRLVAALALLAFSACSRKPPQTSNSKPTAAEESVTSNEQPARAGGLVIGVNTVNVSRQSVADEDAQLAQLRAANVKVIRMPLDPPAASGADPAVDFVARAYKQGIRVVAIVALPARDGAPVRPANKELNLEWAATGLSEIDTDKLRTRFGGQLAALEAAGVQLEAMEVGNEINWTPFNGDFPVPAPGRVLGLSDLEHPADAETKTIVAGYLAYLRALAVVKDLRDHSKLNSRTPIVTAGLSYGGLPGPRPKSTRDAVDVSATLQFFQEHGADKLVDGYGVHVYPDNNPKLTVASRIEAFAPDLFARCTATKPCWVTEWGVNNTSKSCPLDDTARAGVAESVRGAFKSFVDEKKVAALIYFSWSGSPHETEDEGALYRCGAMSKTGSVVLAPL